MTEISIQQLVRQDLINREQEGIRLYGTPLYPYNGRTAILDAYEEALDLCVYLRQVIEEMSIGGKKFPTPLTPAHQEEPHHRAARERADDETVGEQYR